MRSLIALSILLHIGISFRVYSQDKPGRLTERRDGENVGQVKKYPHLRDPRSPHLESLSQLPGAGEASARGEDQSQTPAHLLGDSVYEAWVTRYNGPGNGSDYATALAVDSPGNVYVTGWSPAPGLLPDYATVKYDAAGGEQWVARYDGPGNSDDYARALAIDSSGNVYVTGESPDSALSYDYATIKYDASGEEQWVARYNGPGNDYDFATALAVDGSGNVYVTGYGLGSATGDDYATIKYDASGVEQWVARYNGPVNGGDFGFSLAIDGSGNVYVTGYSLGSSTSYDFATIKYDASGVGQWVARYNGPGNDHDFATALAVDGSGNVYVTGRSYGSGSSYDYATIKYDASGAEQWVARYNGPGNGDDYAYSLAVDSSGNVYVIGESAGSGTATDYATIKYDASGVEHWVARYNGPGNYLDGSHALAVDGSGNVYVTGQSHSGTDHDYATIKYDVSGAEQWVARSADLNLDDYSTGIALDASGNVFVTGCSYDSTFSSDYATLKYEQTATGVEEEEEHPTAYSLSQNYPNPFNPSTTIRVSMPITGVVTLKIYNLLGMQVATLVSARMDAGIHSIEWNAVEQPSGVYFYRLEAGEFTETRKLMLLR